VAWRFKLIYKDLVTEQGLAEDTTSSAVGIDHASGNGHMSAIVAFTSHAVCILQQLCVECVCGFCFKHRVPAWPLQDDLQTDFVTGPGLAGDTSFGAVGIDHATGHEFVSVIVAFTTCCVYAYQLCVEFVRGCCLKHRVPGLVVAS
jgi:hypothetical protein